MPFPVINPCHHQGGFRYYTPSRVGYWLDHWRELTELAMPAPAGIRYDKVGSIPHGSRPADPMRWVDVIADIERAWAHLGNRWSAAFLVVEYTILGYHIREIEDTLHMRHGSGSLILEDACRQMARYLGWQS